MSRKDKDTSQVDLERLRRIFETDDVGLLDPIPKTRRSAPDDRLRQSFLEIAEFVRIHGSEPSSTSEEIHERRLGARLDGIRMSPDKAALLLDVDEFNLLSQDTPNVDLAVLLDPETEDDPLGLLTDTTGLLDTSSLPAISRKQEVRGDVAQRVKCHDFHKFKRLFSQKHDDLANGNSRLVPFAGVSTVKTGEFFVLGGLMVFVAEIGEADYQKDKKGEMRKRERLRLIFENGTESAMYRQSLAIRLTEGLGGFQVVAAEGEFELADDIATGWVYVLRSLSDDPLISSRAQLHKIGFTTQKVSKRIARASKESTFLMAPVEIVAEYRTYNLKVSALEHLLHRVFADVRLDIGQIGADGKIYDSTEWFEVPFPAVDQAIALIGSGEIVDYVYDRDQMRLRRIAQ